MAKTLIYIGIFFIIAGAAWISWDCPGSSDTCRETSISPGEIRLFIFPS